MSTLGVEPDQLKSLATTWRQEADAVGTLAWSAMGEATGDGSDVLATVRAMTDPAQQAMSSISTRYTTLADLIDKFSADIQAKDAEIAGEIGKLGPR
ncbi:MULTISPECIES: type VII secretion target [unclassified Nocardia]|uniref:type VII secretion target n=1 Tax=unclassified Nocardia TaxID=2637762 RepID=UPI0033B16430